MFKMAAQANDKPSAESQIKRKLKSIYNKSGVVGGCLVPAGGSETGKGYLRYHLRYPGTGEVNTTMHRAVFVLEHRRPDLLRNSDAGEVSHRCGNKRCVQINHLVLETSAANNSRRNCHDEGHCFDCQPPCIFAP